eukprot:299287-Rhodomonas_salina.2
MSFSSNHKAYTTVLRRFRCRVVIVLPFNDPDPSYQLEPSRAILDGLESVLAWTGRSSNQTVGGGVQAICFEAFQTESKAIGDRACATPDFLTALESISCFRVSLSRVITAFQLDDSRMDPTSTRISPTF